MGKPCSCAQLYNSWYTLCTCVTGTCHHSLVGNKHKVKWLIVKCKNCKTHTHTHIFLVTKAIQSIIGLLANVNSCSVCPSIQESFWCLVQICEQYLPGYYSPGLVSAIYFLIRKVLDYQSHDARMQSGDLNYYSDRFDIQLC